MLITIFCYVHQLDAIYDTLECNLTLLGATAVEDQLQFGVPDTLRALRQAGIKVIMMIHSYNVNFL